MSNRPRCLNSRLCCKGETLKFVLNLPRPSLHFLQDFGNLLEIKLRLVALWVN